MKRKYDAKGDEIEPDLSNKKKVNTGYLMSSYSMNIIKFFFSVQLNLSKAYTIGAKISVRLTEMSTL